MTVTYTIDVSNANLTSFFRTIFRWRGSLWKLVWAELAIWCIAFAILSLVYRFALNDYSKEAFEKITAYAYQYGDFIPFSFILGYYVTTVVSRWQTQFDSIGWIDKPILLASSYIRGTTERSRMLRRGIARHVCLLQVLVFRSICVPLRKRFPTIDSLVAAGYITQDEHPDLDDNKFWLPVKWAMSYVETARSEGLIESDVAVHDIQEAITSVRGQLLSLWLADWVPVPLTYTQIIFVSVRVYCIVTILGRQYVDTSSTYGRHTIDMYVPLLSMIQFVIYIGWLKVAEALLNPFGADDDDFECSWIVDRNFQVSLAISTIHHSYLTVGMQIADQGTEIAPQIVKDINFNQRDIAPYYSRETVADMQEGPVGSASTCDLPPAHMISAAQLESFRRNSTFHMRVSSALKALKGDLNPSDEDEDVNLAYKRRASLPVAAHLYNRHTNTPANKPNKKWSISSDNYDPTEVEGVAARKVSKVKKFVVRNYSDIEEGEEEERGSENKMLESIPEFTIKRERHMSEGSHSDSCIVIDKENLRKIKSTPTFESSDYEQTPHILLPRGEFLV